MKNKISQPSTSTQSVLCLNEKKCSKSHIRFTSKIMDAKLRDTDGQISDWGTKKHYFYEITNINNSIAMKLTINKGTFSTANRDAYFKDIIDATNPSDKTANWSWKELKNWEILDYSDHDLYDYTLLEYIKSDLDKNLDKAIIELSDFESKL